MVCSTTRVQPRWITTNPSPLPGQGNDREKEITMKNPHAVALGKLGGSATSERKAASSRENGKLGGRPRKEYLVIRAVKGTGGYELVADNGDRPQEGLAHKSAKLAYDDAALLWPSNSTWEGKRIPGGYRITI